MSVVALHSVRDFDEYRAEFEKQIATRRAAGAIAFLLSQVDGDPKRVVVHFGAESAEKVTEFLRGPTMDKILDAQPALDSSRIWIAENVLFELPSAPLSSSESLYLKVPVKDIAKLRAGLAAGMPGFRERGLGLMALMRSHQDPNLAILHLTAPDRARLEEIYSSPVLQGALRDAQAATDRQAIYARDVR
ncbi:MAG TPA: hypothetical protein VLC09_21940 [Polyangiaceae bacterium]|nr:hypothetical protein [Polyangiaceae bacterium]